MKKVMEDVRIERERQECLKAQGKFQWTCADRGIPAEKKLAVLSEEFGEVAREVAEGLIDTARINPENLHKELIQVAAVCVAWCESMQEDAGGMTKKKGMAGLTSEALCTECSQPIAWHRPNPYGFGCVVETQECQQVNQNFGRLWRLRRRIADALEKGSWGW